MRRDTSMIQISQLKKFQFSQKIFFFFFFFQNAKTNEIGGILMVSEKSKITVFRTSFTQGFSRSGGIVCFIENYNIESSFVNCIFRNNSALISLMDSTNAKVLISDSKIENNSNIFFSALDSNIVFEGISVKNHECRSNGIGCFLNAQDNSIISLFGVSLFNISSLMGEGTVYCENAKILIQNSNFSFLKNKNFIGSCASVYSSILQVKNSSFQDYDINCLFSRKKSRISIESSIFSQENHSFSNNAKLYGTIFCEDCLIFNIFNSSFDLNTNVQQGAAIKIISTKSSSYFDSETGFIDSCNFDSNLAFLQGGAIYVFNQNVSIVNNIFKNNSAVYGGAIFLDNNGKIKYKNKVHIVLDNLLMISNIKNNNFYSNVAAVAGGAIKWSKEMPIIDTNNVFSLNSAQYGSNIAAYPIRLLVEIHLKENYTTPDNNLSILANGMDNKTIVLGNISGGNDFPYVIVSKTVDLYGNIVKLDNAY